MSEMNLNFRKANNQDISAIWTILEQAILRRKNDGSTQWQDGYPNPEVIQKLSVRRKGCWIIRINSYDTFKAYGIANFAGFFIKFIQKPTTKEISPIR